MTIWRFTSSGNLDSTFSDDGTVTFTGCETTCSGKGVAIDPEQRIVVAGYLDDDMAVWRYDRDGNIDTSFANGGVYKWSGTGYNSGQSVAIDSDGRIVVAGIIKGNTANPKLAIWRINP
jgi:uncharacterized delta-60 repeat protein